MVDNVLSEKERAEKDPIGYIQQMFFNLEAFVPEEVPEDDNDELYKMLHSLGLNKEQLLQVDDMIGNIMYNHEQKGFKQGYNVATRIIVGMISQT